MEKYSEYKDSGVQWLGKIPGHWKLCKMGFLFEHNTGKALAGSKNSGAPRPYITTSNLYWDSFDLSSLKEMPFQDDEVDRYTIRKGDLLVCEGGDIGRSAIWNSDDTMYIQNHIHRLRSIREICTRYYLYYMFTAKSLGGIGGKGIAIQGFSSGALHALKAILPPLPEQQAIVAFLDGKCGKIDRLLENKQKELDLLLEMKQRIIADAVTRGLDPSAPLTKTGIFWQPEMPVGWTIRKLGHILKKEDRPRPEGAELLICTNKGEVILRGDSKAGLVSETEEIYQGVKKGDLLIHGMDTWHGAIAVSENEGMCTPVVHVCTSEEDVNYVSFYMRSMAYNKVFKLISNGVRQNTSDFRSWGKVRIIPIPLPPIAEQRAIVSYINSRVEKIDALAAKLQQEIDNIKEYKQRLISDVVTGQIKVC